MQEFGSITDHIDIAQLTLYAFWIFFFGLIVYLRREDTREGYPLEADVGGRIRRKNFLFYPKAKVFKLPHDRGTLLSPNDERDTRPVAAKRSAPYPGAALIPTGDPMKDGVGPAAWAERKQQPDLTLEGEPLLAPLRILPDYSVPKASRDPRGFTVRGADGVAAGKVSEIWVNRAEGQPQLFEVTLDGGKSIILPIAFARVALDTPNVTVRAINGSQFGDVPRLAKKDEITKYEEERIAAYYGGGYLYADPKRAEPLV